MGAPLSAGAYFWRALVGMAMDKQLSQRNFGRLALALLAVGFALLGAAFFASVNLTRVSQRSDQMVQHTFQVMTEISNLNVHVERAETAVRGYLLAPDPERARNSRTTADLIPDSLAQVATLTTDNAAQQSHLDALQPVLLEELATLDRIMDLATGGDVATARATFIEFAKRHTVTEIRKRTDAMTDAERKLLGTRQVTATRDVGRLQSGLAIAGALLVMVGLGAAYLVWRYTRELVASRERLHFLNSDLEGAVKERTADLTRANQEIQRFAYIVSHDLRSPLVNVMGFTSELERADKVVETFVGKIEQSHPDLVTDEVRLAAREDLPEAIGFIRSSTQKMDRLINAILTLSRQGRRTLNPEPLAMDRIMGDIVDSLAKVADERDAAITVAAPLPALHHDRLAIEQIFSNLIENATKYLRPGVPGTIVVRGTADARRARFEVQDNGRGVDPNDHERIFELFRRSGVQDQRGEGIGLAHVRALAYRLGGSVTIASELGQGSTFIVDLPVKFSGEGE